MDTQEAIKLIDVVSQSLRNDPSQFHYVVHSETTGLKVEHTGPGTGLNIVASGSGTGMQINVSSATVGNIQLMRKAIDEAIREDVTRALKLLEEIKAELSEKTPNNRKLEKVLEGLKNTILTPAIIAAIQASISMAIQR